jgi:hypothetical protein
MNRSFACLVLTGLALVAGGAAVMSASEPPLTTDVDVLVNGSPQTRFAYGGRWYVEALKGREYAIRLRNPYGVRVAVALSVDGLNTIDARHTNAAEARKWIIDPYQTITISGWQTSRTVARRFEFTTEEQSYAQALGQPSDLGVITAVYFRERVRPVVVDGTTTRSGGSGGRGGGTGAGRERDAAGAPEPSAPPAAPAAQGALGDIRANKAEQRTDEYAATGMGRQTDHAITQIWLDLEDAPVQQVNIRYEFRPQLVRLGILPPAPGTDPLRRRERASGFEPGFSPAPPALR